MTTPLAKAKRVVVKIGSSLLTAGGAGLDRAAISDWVGQVAALRAKKIEVIVVSSGAIAEGMQRLGWSKRPHAVNELQAAAAVGQMGLVQVWESCFSERDLHTAQVLLTNADLADRNRYLNARTTLRTLLGLGVIPVINENDTVVVDEIRFGDNDTLAALVANLIEADALVILTDQAGLFSADPRKDPKATLVSHAIAGEAKLEAIAGGAGSHVGSGGMITKVLAAKRAARSGAHTAIVSGREADVLSRLFSGESIGTLLEAQTAPLAARKQWLADHLQPAGRITLDAGAVKALVTDRKSLLAVGATAVTGDFGRGEVVSVLGPDGREIARGLANYGASDVLRILRKPTTEIEAILGYLAEPELIHRDNLVVL
ncbi:glutamate 5-kinase [Usitatibacter palustris]|uniref:Glutamate 5-kinase n=1 Tax=Usitatibacter palustris TaxID=2732487 RepID=A0A6M4HBT3_9PROT|nr:glutamate 5-kinase [Usitatibacter palustris]QJR15954.1 Glutamate 5-kinase [Usitatibacter palustris]